MITATTVKLENIFKTQIKDERYKKKQETEKFQLPHHSNIMVMVMVVHIIFILEVNIEISLS